MNNVIKPNFGPKNLTIQDNSRFVLSSSEWLAIQRYVTHASKLPTTDQEVRRQFNMKETDSLDQLKDMIDVYKGIITHVDQWKDQTLPKAVQLASDIVNYAGKVETYYSPLLPLIQKLSANPGDQASKDRFLAIVDSLLKEATKNEENARAVLEGVNRFADDTARDKTAVDTVYDKYTRLYGEESETTKKWAKAINDAKAGLDTALSDYEHHVIVAATTAAYIWIFPLGTVAGGTVATVWGLKAAEAKEMAEKFRNEMREASDKVSFATNLVLWLNMAKDSLGLIRTNIDSALPVIQKIKGAWSAITHDLTYVKQVITSDIRDADVILRDLGVELAMNQWKRLAREADGFRINAYISVSEPQEAGTNQAA